MGNGTVTLSGDPLDFGISRKYVFGTLALSSSYATQGDSFTAGQFGLEKIDFLTMDTGTPGTATTAYVLAWTPATTTGQTAAFKIQAFQSGGAAAPLAEVGAGVNLTTFTADFMAVGW